MVYVRFLYNESNILIFQKYPIFQQSVLRNQFLFKTFYSVFNLERVILQKLYIFFKLGNVFSNRFYET